MNVKPPKPPLQMLVLGPSVHMFVTLFVTWQQVERPVRAGAQNPVAPSHTPGATAAEAPSKPKPEVRYLSNWSAPAQWLADTTSVQKDAPTAYT